MTDAILALQKPVMLFFQSIRMPFLNSLAEIITMAGEAGLSIMVLIIFYWCIDKRKGFAIGGTLLSANVAMNTLKVIFRVPRPWVRYPGEIETLRQSTATGYSFPSGHSTTSGALWGTMTRFVKQKWLKAVLVALVVLVPLSRVYLCCHWPMDVIVGTALGLAFALFISKKMYGIYDDEEKFGRMAVPFATVTGIVALVLAILLEGGALEPLLWKDYMETAILCSGLFLGAYLEKTRIGFTVPSTLKKKVLVLIPGAVAGIGIWLLIKSIPLFPYIMKCAAYFFLPFYVAYIYPAIGTKYGFFEKE